MTQVMGKRIGDVFIGVEMSPVGAEDEWKWGQNARVERCSFAAPRLRWGTGTVGDHVPHD